MMAKLDALKEKIAGLKQKLAEKVDKIPFLKKLLTPAPAAVSTPDAPARPSSSLGSIYQKGGVFTRLQVLFFFVLVLAALGASAYVGVRIFKRISHSPAHEQLAADYSHGIGEVKRRMEENASVLSLGKFTVSAFASETRKTIMSIDIWIRVDSVEAANFAQSHEIILHDKAMEALEEIYMQKVNLLTEQGKIAGRERIKELLNRSFPKGHVEEVFFYNIVIQ